MNKQEDKYSKLKNGEFDARIDELKDKANNKTATKEEYKEYEKLSKSKNNLGKVENVLEHHMHSEFYDVEEEEAKKINECRKNGGRVIAVGTTSCRTLESVTGEDGIVKAGNGWTEIFIYPGYKFKAIDCLITNFHLPESTLLMLVSALAGRENIMAAYEEAVKEKYRFFSFGDAMFITDNETEEQTHKLI